VLAIIALTVIIRLATSPLLIRQQQATAKMTEMQPKLKKLQEKYKNDREKLAHEQMKLYKEAGVNPLGGCLPIFIQLPIMIALYQAIIMGLASTPFQVVDLSGRFLLSGLGDLVPLQNQWAGMDLTLAPTMNPIYALAFPLVVGITTWLQSKLTMPAPQPSGDARADQTVQITQSMATIMPVMFAFFSLSFSVGLSIYFVVSNVVGILQYTMMGKADWKGLFSGKKATTTNKTVVSETSSTTKKQAIPAKATSSGGHHQDEVVVTATPRPRANRNDKKMRPKK
jgi:YidC/Oxa1 family membrane protein insertase